MRTTVDGSEIRPVEVGSLSHKKVYISQVVQDFFHQQYGELWGIDNTHGISYLVMIHTKDFE